MKWNTHHSKPNSFVVVSTKSSVLHIERKHKFIHWFCHYPDSNTDATQFASLKKNGKKERKNCVCIQCAIILRTRSRPQRPPPHHYKLCGHCTMNTTEMGTFRDNQNAAAGHDMALMCEYMAHAMKKNSQQVCVFCVLGWDVRAGLKNRCIRRFFCPRLSSVVTLVLWFVIITILLLKNVSFFPLPLLSFHAFGTAASLFSSSSSSVFLWARLLHNSKFSYLFLCMLYYIHKIASGVCCSVHQRTVLIVPSEGERAMTDAPFA